MHVSSKTHKFLLTEFHSKFLANFMQDFMQDFLRVVRQHFGQAFLGSLQGARSSLSRLVVCSQLAGALQCAQWDVV